MLSAWAIQMRIGPTAAQARYAGGTAPAATAQISSIAGNIAAEPISDPSETCPPTTEGPQGIRAAGSAGADGPRIRAPGYPGDDHPERNRAHHVGHDHEEDALQELVHDHPSRWARSPCRRDPAIGPSLAA